LTNQKTDYNFGRFLLNFSIIQVRVRVRVGARVRVSCVRVRVRID
jgi:hypothetical protein